MHCTVWKPTAILQSLAVSLSTPRQTNLIPPGLRFFLPQTTSDSESLLTAHQILSAHLEPLRRVGHNKFLISDVVRVPFQVAYIAPLGKGAGTCSRPPA